MTNATSLRVLIPGLLALAGVADLAARALVPREAIAFRGWEAVSENPSPPFRPSARWSGTTYGDLASLGNLPECRVYREETFTTDGFGFRNAPRLAANGPPDVLLVGDSFTLLTGSDDETLSVRLSEASGRSVYNLGGVGPHLGHLRRAAAGLSMSKGLVLYEWVYRLNVPRRELVWAEAPRREGWARLGSLAAAEGWSGGPLELLARRAFRWVERQGVIPNSPAHGVIRRPLAGGPDLLFYPGDDWAPIGRWPDAAFDFLKELEAELRPSGFGLAVVFVPTKSTVYGGAYPDVPQPSAEDLARIGTLAERLRASGLPALDLGPALRREAERALREDRLLFWRDDTHWNPEGIRVAARLLAPLLR